MKKVVDTLFILWIILFISFLVFTGYYLYDIREENILVHRKAQQNTSQEDIVFGKDNVEHLFVLEGNIKDEVVFYAASFYFSIPEFIRTEFKKDGWQVVLTDKDISKQYYNGPVKGRLSGLASSREKKLYVHGSRNDIRRSMIHEFGHYWDYTCGIPSTDAKFNDIYLIEKETFYEKWKTDDHATSNSQEYFAEAFAQLILYPNILKKNCPNTYKYLQDIVSENNTSPITNI